MSNDAAYHALIARIHEEIPGFKVAYKDDPPASMPWSHRVIHAIAQRLVPRYSSSFTTVLAPVVYLPSSSRDAYAEAPSRWYETMRHELIHLRDARDHPVWMALSYVLFPLPLGLTWRAYWELRGYTQTMLVRYERGLPLDGDFSDRLISIFCGRDYLFMLPPLFARRVVTHMRDRITRGDAAGLDVEIHWWRDFLRPMLWPAAPPRP
jgi:hypothetical protein